MTDKIVIPDGQLGAALELFIDDTALSYCATIGHDNINGVGTRVLVADRHLASFSGGERHLWKLAASVASGELRELIEGVDAPSLGAIGDLFALLYATKSAAA